MLLVEFEPTIPAFDQSKIIQALDCAAIVVGTLNNNQDM
jgi:hypothetical protein